MPNDEESPTQGSYDSDDEPPETPETAKLQDLAYELNDLWEHLESEEAKERVDFAITNLKVARNKEREHLDDG